MADYVLSRFQQAHTYEDLRPQTNSIKKLKSKCQQCLCY